MVSWDSGMQEPKEEEEMPINESITTSNDPPSKIIGEDLKEDKGEDTNNTTQQMLPHPWTIHPFQWIYPEAVLQTTGKDEEHKEIGDIKDTKDEWPKDPETTLIMLVSIVDKSATLPETVPNNEETILNPTSSILTMSRNRERSPRTK